MLIETLDVHLLVFLENWVKTFVTYRPVRTTVFSNKAFIFFNTLTPTKFCVMVNIWWVHYTSTKIDNFEISREAGCHTVLWLTGQKNVTYETSFKLQGAFFREDRPQNMLK